MTPGFQYDAPIGVRLSDPSFLRHELLLQARRTDKAGKHILAAAMRQDADALHGMPLFNAAISARYQVAA